MPRLLLFREKCIEPGNSIEAAVRKNRKLDELSTWVLPLQLRRPRLNVGNLEMGIEVEDLKSCACVNDCTVALRLNAEDLKTQQSIHLNLGRIIRSGNDHPALRLDVFVAVIADLVCQGLAGLQSWKKIYTRRPVFRGTNADDKQSDRAINGDAIFRATRQIARAIHQRPAKATLTSFLQPRRLHRYALSGGGQRSRQ